MRILHISDIHIAIPFRDVPLAAWFGKRALGGLNVLLGRGRQFANARRKVAALAPFAEEQQVDLVLCSGDYTGLGLEQEYLAARQAVDPLMRRKHGFVTVPGNHDLYVREVVRQGRFEQHFGDTLTTDLPQYQADGGWPRVRLIDDDLAVACVNSSRPNTFWRSSGRVPEGELAKLREALRDPAVEGRFVFIMTHYAPCLEEGRPDHKSHCLVNVDDFLDACGKVRRGALLCGHVHRRFHARLPDFDLPVFCSGSTTKEGREGLWLYELEGGRLRATPGTFSGDGYQLDPESAI